jgi:hypothetical protein
VIAAVVILVLVALGIALGLLLSGPSVDSISADPSNNSRSTSK